MYRLYGQNKIKGWEKIQVKKDLNKILDTARTLTADEYSSYMVIENNGNGDNVIIRENIYKECEVEYVDELKTDFEVRAKIFKESLKVIDKVNREIEQTKIDVRTDKELTNEQKREQLKGIDRISQIEEVMRKINEEQWEK